MAHVQDAPSTESRKEPLPADSTSSSTSPIPWKASGRTKIIFGSICVLALMSALDGTSIGTALPAISTALHGNTIEGYWAGISFLLCSTVWQPTFVSFSSIFGRRNLFLLSVFFFFAGALVCCLAQNFTTLLAGRSIQGTGAGGIMAISDVLITDLVPLRYRGDYYGLINVMWTVGTVTGPILGGGFSGNEHATWRWIFYINFPFIGIATILIIVFMRLHFKPTSLAQKLYSVDWIGSIILIGSSTAFLLGLSWGGVMYPWGSYQTLLPLLLGAAGCAVFGVYEAFVAAEPIIAPILFRESTTVISFIGTVPVGLIMWCLLYYLPLYYEAVLGYRPVIAGVALFPLTFTLAPAAAIAGNMITRTGSYRWATWLGWSVGSLGLGLLCLLKLGTSIPAWIFITLVPGIGLGLLFPGLGFAIQASVPAEHVAMAIALFSFFRAAGQAIGVAVGGVVFENRMYKNLLAYPNLVSLASEYSSNAESLVNIINSMPDGPDKSDLRTAYADSLRVVWAVCCGVAGLALLISIPTKHYNLDQVLNTSQGIIEKEKDKSEESGGSHPSL